MYCDTFLRSSGGWGFRHSSEKKIASRDGCFPLMKALLCHFVARPKKPIAAVQSANKSSTSNFEKLPRRESSGGMEWLGVWDCIFSGSQGAAKGARQKEFDHFFRFRDAFGHFF